MIPPLETSFSPRPLPRRSAASALYLLASIRPAVCVALEIGPRTPNAFFLDAHPTVWVTDSYAATDPRDLDLLDDAATGWA